MTTASHYFVSFEGVTASVGGIDISSIFELQLTAQANGIPTVTLLVDAGATGDDGTVVADAMTLGGARSLLDRCRGLVKTSGGALSLSLTARAVGEFGDVKSQTLSLSGWLLTDVSLSPIQERGVCAASLTFMHPICKAHFGGVVPGLLATPVLYADLDGNNPLEVFLNALTLYGDAAEREEPREIDTGGAGQAEIRANLLSRLAKARSDLEASLAWAGGGLPAEEHLASWGELQRAGLAVYAEPSGGSSVFQRFASGMVPECSLAIGGDFTTQVLEVRPFEPWADASMTITDADIISMQFPQHDPSPLSGVRLTSTASADAVPFSFHIDTGQSRGKPSDVFYAPESELSAEYLYGPIVEFQEPGWLAVMRQLAGLSMSTERSDAKGAQGGGLETAATISKGGSVSFGGGDVAQASIDYGSAMLACAKAYYETSLMKDWAFEVNARLMFNVEGATICPGKVISVTSNGNEALAGYVTSVTHAISVANGSAHTIITCSHPRFGSIPAGVASSRNPLY